METGQNGYLQRFHTKGSRSTVMRNNGMFRILSHKSFVQFPLIHPAICNTEPYVKSEINLIAIIPISPANMAFALDLTCLVVIILSIN